MHDWQEITRQQLELRDLSPGQREEIVREVAAYLEDDYEEGIECGLAESEAAERALAGIRWGRLARKIQDARTDNSESGRRAMNQRTKKLWVPVLASLTLNAVLLVIFDQVHARPLIVNLGHLAMTLQLTCLAAMAVTGHMRLEEGVMNQRTKSVWVPGFVSLTTAVLFMFGEEIVLMHDSSFYFTDLSLRPSHLISGLPFWFYCGWLCALVLCGSLGAFLSRRNGGTRAARVVAGAFPALVMFLLCGLGIPVSALLEHNAYVFYHPAGLALAILIWAGAPGLALLLGASPFLKESRLTAA